MTKPLNKNQALAILNFLPPSSKAILEIGCGDGLLGKMFLQTNPSCQYLGIEPHLELTDIAKNRLTILLNEDIQATNSNKFKIDQSTLDCLIYSDSIDQIEKTRIELKETKQTT